MQHKYSAFGAHILFSLLGGSALLWSCGPTETTCEDGIGCTSGGSAGAGAGTAAGTGGNSSTAGTTSAGEGGSVTGGGSSGGKGAGGSASGGAGDAGAGAGGTVSQPCDGACTAPKAVCDEPNDICVECLEMGDCAAGAKKKCDTTAKTCVQCLASTDCTDAKAARCDDGACVKCTSNDDCAHVAGKTVCDAAAGECVQCTGKDYASCGMSMGTPLVCDTLKRTCTTNKQHSGDLCRPCSSDVHCPAGQLCVKETFGQPAEDVGYFCFWKKGDVANGAPATCSAAKPYSSPIANQTSIDGTRGDICGLRSSTCVARDDVLDSIDCGTGNAADNTKCGFAAGVDSKCVDNGGDFRCTMACAGNEDCPGNLMCDGTSFCKL